MKVFISWSGDQGKAFAKLLHAWLPIVLQAVKPFLSPDDVTKGAMWRNAAGSELDASQMGIIVVTRESLSAPWIMFEAGALAKNVGRSKIVPVLVDLEPTDIRGPLTQFQCARLDSTDMKRLLRMLNSELCDLSLTDDVLESAFTVWWPEFQSQVAQLLKQTPRSERVEQPTERELLEEILALSRSIAEHKSEAPPSSGLQESAASFSGALTLASVQKRLAAGGNLVGANLMNLNLAHQDLTGANLKGANLVRSNLSGARLVDANLEGANLEGAVMNGADLAGARISRTNLWCVSMRSVKNLSAVASMEDANFYKVDLDDSDRQIVAQHRTVSLGDYPTLFGYYRKKGMSKAKFADVFLWTAHAYPGEAF
jgi:hypothetical protein